MLKRIQILALLLLQSFTFYAQSGEDFMRSSGKIYVVVGVVVMLFLGIVFYLIRLERKIKKLENRFNNE